MSRRKCKKPETPPNYQSMVDSPFTADEINWIINEFARCRDLDDDSDGDRKNTGQRRNCYRSLSPLFFQAVQKRSIHSPRVRLEFPTRFIHYVNTNRRVRVYMCSYRSNVFVIPFRFSPGKYHGPEKPTDDNRSASSTVYLERRAENIRKSLGNLLIEGLYHVSKKYRNDPFRCLGKWLLIQADIRDDEDS